MQIVILAGGLGTRLKPITEKIPKVMIEIKGRPFLEYQFAYLKKCGFKKFLLLLSYLGDQIQNHFKDGRAAGIAIDYSFEKEPMGTAGALKAAEKKLENSFLLINGDTFYPLPFDNFLSRARKTKGVGLMAVYDNHEKVAANNVRADGDGIIRAYSRERAADGFNGVDGGITFYRKRLLNFIPENKKAALEEEVYPLLIRQGLLEAYFTKSRYYDMGTFERLEIVKKIFES